MPGANTSVAESLWKFPVNSFGIFLASPPLPCHAVVKARARVVLPNRSQMEFRASEVDSLVIVGVEVATAGSDQGQMVPTIEQVRERCGQAPEAWLVDGGLVGHQQIEQASAHATVYGPVPAAKDKAVDPHQPKPDDSPAVAAWRARMGTDEAKAVYKNRAATAACVNAQSRNRGLQQFGVRGLAKVKCVVLFFALAHNLMRMASLAPELLALGKGVSAVSGIGA
jgi:hypothetical protein